jgi:riboflavin synthase
MFTGIVTEVGHVLSTLPNKLIISASQVLKGLELGGSVAVNGACLTVTAFTADSFSVDVTPETIMRTNLGILTTGDPVNLERPLGVGGELGGHLVQGHIDGTGKITGITPVGGAAAIYRFEAPPEIMRYLVEKAFIAVEGISLTVTRRNSSYFEVSVIDYTRRHTNLIDHKVGDLVNLEVDIMAKYVERYMQAQRPNLTIEFLRENGF